jgi:hypothetical protein
MMGLREEQAPLRNPGQSHFLLYKVALEVAGFLRGFVFVWERHGQFRLL